MMVVLMGGVVGIFSMAASCCGSVIGGGDCWWTSANGPAAVGKR